MNHPEFEYLGPYRVEGILGRGGMGTVYKGSHSRSGEKVAIKVIAAAVANQTRFRRRFAATRMRTLIDSPHTSAPQNAFDAVGAQVLEFRMIHRQLHHRRFFKVASTSCL